MISIIVCTRNREDLIDDCIQSLIDQKTTFDYEIIVVNNDSDDGTEEKLKKYDQVHSNFRFIKETKLGLSHARNAGFQSAKYDWVANVDDDAKAHKDFVEVACETIIEQEFDCFGGIYNAWFKFGKPSWFPKGSGTNRTWMPNQTCVLTDENFSGGVAVYKKELLREVGWFPVNMGMKGKKVGYGAENYVQEKAKEIGYIVGFTPDLQIDHLVRKDKLNKSWHYNAAYQNGRAKAELQNENKIDRRVLKYGLLEILKYPIRLLLNKTSFHGNKKLKYYQGYFTKLTEMRRNNFS